MFCPEDCVLLTEIVGNCERVAYNLMPYTSGQEYVRLADSHEVDFERSCGERRRILEGIIFQYFLTQYPHSAFAYSPHGILHRLSHHAIRPLYFNHFQRYTQEFYKIGTDLLFVDGSTGTIQTKQSYEKFDAEEGEGLKIWWAEIASILAPMDGWPVCFKRSEVASSKDEIQKAWGKRSKSSEFAIGRPRIQESAARSYQICFPNGHSGQSWKEVLDRVSKTAGRDVSLDTLKRGLGLRG